MSDKTFKIVNGDISDGYHTFDELYEHRCLLWIAFCLERHSQHPEEKAAFWLRDHYEGWDLLATDLLNKQVSYHIPKKFRYLYEGIVHEILGRSWEFDGHTPADVLQRLEDYCTKF